MKVIVWIALIAIIQTIMFSAIFTPNEIISQYCVLLALGLSLYTGITIRE